jgi:protein gp37
MADHSAIGWTDATWNPTTGCDKVSPGCDNCYALTLAKRLKAMGSRKYQRDGDPRTSGPGFGLNWHSGALNEPRRWRRPRMVFVNSMSDLFHARVPAQFIVEVFAVMAVARQHTYQVLTKRPERMARIVGAPGFRERVQRATVVRVGGKAPWLVHPWWPLRHVWLGTSVESDGYVRRVDALRRTPAAVRFVSAEPLLGPLPSLDLTGIDWLITGGESGPGARPVDAGWVRDLRDRCTANGTAFFHKQWGGRTPRSGGRELDGRTWDEYPTAVTA